jgi:CheY-like chemotaxis protein
MTLRPYLYANKCTPPCTILLVEDEPFVRDATRAILESAGFAVLPAEDAPEAIKAFENCNPAIDLVMTDMVLPGKSGLELVQYLRSHSPQLVILLTSGYSNPGCDAEAPESRIYFLAKPYSKRTLLDKIQEILSTESRPRPTTPAP